ncbi:HprK-related kinase A [Chitinimonas sp. BJB300]|uniref:HprK-related kinase A n=1 Tax=Chitinimonas sp. BJB300 TaxID=1559339 RepID=UPI000C11EA97|nr:HprK-related kinase A [Chitinimonas sp. BJB300]PHV13366.1 HprK-related kinase A [Chitinimonas sp. BJB300]TSJ85282.1 HprK-related kinase A [Chitinimonas sp. BJB300]
MNVRNLTPVELERKLADGGIYIKTGPFVCHIQSTLPHVVHGIATAYADYSLVEQDYADFHVNLASPWLRRWFYPQVQFRSDLKIPFLPLPVEQAYALFEWGMNWCVSQHANQYLILHAAVLEKNGRALILPGHSGAGKSTLCAGLVYGGGWRLLSDELTLIRPGDGLIQPLPRPVSLKNRSIEVIQALVPELVFTPVVRDTQKGSVAHAKPPEESIQQQACCVPAAWVVFPNYCADKPINAEPIAPAQVVLKLAEQAFNYSLHGKQGFDALADLVGRATAYHFEYSQLVEAIGFFDELANAEPVQIPPLTERLP